MNIKDKIKSMAKMYLQMCKISLIVFFLFLLVCIIILIAQGKYF